MHCPTLLSAAFLSVVSVALPGSAAVSRTVVEAEDAVVNRDALRENAYSDNGWNLWSTDKDRFEKWSEGVVIQGPRVMQDRSSPEEGAPVLHLMVKDIPPGTYDLTLKTGRVLGISFDGNKWERCTGGVVATDISPKDGAFEFWIDDRYAMETESRRGSGYLDTITLDMAMARDIAAGASEVQGWAQERIREPMGRGVVALTRADGSAYIGWRLLEDDRDSIGFNVFRRIDDRQAEKLNDRPIVQTTDFVDTSATDAGAVYLVKPDNPADGVAGEAGLVPERDSVSPSVSIRLDDEKTLFQKVGIADLNGDGVYDYVIKHPHQNIDPWNKYWYKSPDTYKLEGYLADGTFLWQIDLGWGIERGIWYSPYLVHDLTGDGKAEVAAKVGEGDPRDEDGRVTTGAEWLAVWDGMTGKEIARTPWPPRGDFDSYNHASRNQIAVAYLDGKTPCLLALRGTYTRMRVDAYQLLDGKLDVLWRYDNRDMGRRCWGQGAHFTLAADVDEDGRDEVLLGSLMLDDTGVPLWTTGRGHPDAAYLTDVDPSVPGMEIAYVMETRQNRGGGLNLVSAATGKELWKLEPSTRHVHGKGMCADIDPLVRGMEVYGADADGHTLTEARWLFAADGTLLKSGTECTWGFNIPTAWWDADLQREIVKGKISDYGGSQTGDRIEGSVKIQADVLGDWREELITSVEGELRIYSTTLPAMDRRVCLMQDHVYRMGTCMNAMGYTQEPTLSYNLEATAPNLNLTFVETGEDSPYCRVAVSASATGGVTGKLVMVPPEGITVEPLSVDVALGPGERLVRKVQVKNRTDNRFPGELMAELRLADRALVGRVPLVLAGGFLASESCAEAEEFTEQTGGDVQIRTDKPGVRGKAISHWDDAGHALSWTVDTKAQGTHALIVRYCTPRTVTRKLSVDGETPRQIKLLSTGGFGTTPADWDHARVSADGRAVLWTLEPGKHTVRLENDDGNGCNLDYLALIPAAK